MALELWDNPHLSESVRLETALAEIARLKAQIDLYETAPVVAYMSSRNGFIAKENKNPEYNIQLVKKVRL